MREHGSGEPRLSLADAYRRMVRIRAFEESLLSEYRSGRLRGTTHTSLGQEAVAVAAMAAIEPRDLVFSNHRGHGHFLAYGGDMWALLAEIAGRSEGVCRGLGGSQHLCWRNFLSNGVQGGMTPIAAGAALAERIKGTGALSLVFLGDGTLGEGAVYETFNVASLWSLPVLFVIENNRYAQTTPIELNLAGSIAARPAAFGIETAECDGNDFTQAAAAFAAAAARVRTTGRPFCQIAHTYRLGPHSRGDDFRDPAEVERWRERDPIRLTRTALAPDVVAAIDIDERAAVDACLARLETPDAGALDVPFAKDVAQDRTGHPGWLVAGGEMGGAARLRQTFAALMEEEPRLQLIGEDLLDPSGGAFTLYRGLSTRYPDRVHTTPISESAIVGLANGMALRGLRPVAEIMFGDFLSLTMDQLFNHATKFGAMYARQATCPTIVRTPVGAYRGYGPTHSQSPEKHFIGIPGLTVTALSPVHDPLVIWRGMLSLDSPCLHVEGKLHYGQAFRPYENGRIDGFVAVSDYRLFPTLSLQLVDGDKPDLVIAAYGEQVPLAFDVARQLFVTREAIVRVVVPSCLSPLPVAAVTEFAGTCRALLTIEEGSAPFGWGAGLAAELLPALPGLRVARIGALSTIIPTSAAGEAHVMPGLDRAMAAALEIMGGR